MTRRYAEFSPDRVYRYRLELRWATGRAVNFVMLNPSTADENHNDPTVERCQRRALMMGYPALIVTNLFAYRSTDPKSMIEALDPIGVENDKYIQEAAAESELIICGWGDQGTHMQRDEAFWRLVPRYMCRHLKLTRRGQPWHPLYVRYSEQPKPWPNPVNYADVPYVG